MKVWWSLFVWPILFPQCSDAVVSWRIRVLDSTINIFSLRRIGQGFLAVSLCVVVEHMSFSNKMQPKVLPTRLQPGGTCFSKLLSVMLAAHAASLLVVFSLKIISLALQELNFLQVLLPGVQDMKHCSVQCILFHSCWSLRKQLRSYCLFQVVVSCLEEACLEISEILVPIRSVWKGSSECWAHPWYVVSAEVINPSAPTMWVMRSLLPGLVLQFSPVLCWLNFILSISHTLES